MNPALEYYYVTNYSNCEFRYNFFDSHQSIVYSSYAIQLVSIPFQMLAFYVIIFQTPVAMKISKTPLLINHTFCAILDVVLCTLCPLYLFLPMTAVSCIGLLSWFGLPTLLQLSIICLAEICAALSYINLFESRASSLLANRFRISSNKSKILYYCAVMLPAVFLTPLLKFFPEDQDVAKLEALKIYPCPTQEFFTTSVFIALIDQVAIRYAIIPLALAVSSVLGHFLFHMVCLVYYIYVVPSKFVSKETQGKQKTFLISILFQTSIPFAVVIIPLAIVFAFNSFGYYSQKAMNLAFCCALLHGLCESVGVIVVHKPYRDVIGLKIGRLLFKRSEISIHVQPSLTRASGNLTNF
ncbi:Serpentine Receptor, class H [Caenorhabditis elegans]|uniref:Serpentine Receptor, class H n=1 Tax=Caenorhabditis elegans TaxID=6239 RepID=Q9XXP5_CAEEL|nr:Serpentine Receptor, class H [Caenorhabditis elegans]CAA16499.1 Serpentine Receptor, class H [Caenorhabditis elegans]|eukprot:NP_507424.1 Serpentine Receptor, class H [Caenorhabditis elegans]